ncbi:hypothetical protein [Lacinutrix himadriensis]|uniref:hypothetical protein n=1 Tax=Lacinutrix himadriensis TaxID=641549 RepID=UPI00128F6106|nr:hypothetical protein [Lacinutrix himadriensis]
MKHSIYIFLFCFTYMLHAQNIHEKTFSEGDISTISINGKNVFKITVDAKPVHEITVHSRVEGENNENIVLVTETKNSNLYIAIKQQPLFVDANDKLSAHKVISVEINLVIPEYLSMGINLYESDLIVNGNYKSVSVNSDSGNCFFNAFYGDAKIYTRDGNIAVQTNKANISATSKNGDIKQEEIDSGSHEIIIKTINGNVTVSKSQ